MNEKRYLGDGCFVKWDGYSLILTTENGIERTNMIVLEPEVYNGLLRFRDECVPPTERDPG